MNIFGGESSFQLFRVLVQGFRLFFIPKPRRLGEQMALQTRVRFMRIVYEFYVIVLFMQPSPFFRVQNGRSDMLIKIYSNKDACTVRGTVTNIYNATYSYPSIFATVVIFAQINPPEEHWIYVDG